MFLTIIVSLSLLLLGSGIFIYYTLKKSANKHNLSNYEIYLKSQFNQPSFYPSNQTISSSVYQPVSVWTGRLILLPKEQRQPKRSVLFEVYNADTAHQNLVGKIVNLEWSRDSEVQKFVRAVTQNVKFIQATEDSKKTGNLHPDRLNNWQNVDPLESLAGARPQDDVIVELKNPSVVTSNKKERPSLMIAQEPVQITGRIYALVTIIKREKADSVSAASPSEGRFVVRHFNKKSKQFDGLLETIRIPQVPSDRNGITRSTNRGIENSPLNPTGWYIYGTKDAEGMFVTQAIEPRALMRLQPDEVRLNQKSAISYIKKELWKDTESQKGTAKIVLLDPKSQQFDQAVSKWREGDKAIVLHTYGGIGGKKPEAEPLGVVTGHFAYGIATVVRDRFTNELRFDIEYRQVYAHNPDGIIAGTMKWSTYMGDLQRGWLGNRPVSDVIVKLDAVTQDYNFDGIQLSPMKEFMRQLDIMMARYRIGDGTGSSVVTPSTSCVQDANQALFVTIKQVEKQVASNPRIQEWLRRHPTDAQTLRFQQLVKLGRSLEKQLAPLGIIRSDWQENAENLAGTRTADGTITTILKAATTWRTMLPRRAHDEIATILLKNGATLWVIRTNQVGGFNPDIVPRAPTALLGHRTR
ncbi:abortive infection protein [Coleofasciculus sp. H7-2]|uniref:abortive infection protein n=1 Tax=Coleofasciculus sp. H7-2 TaxID=3351545 RepID=UPI00366B8586